MQSVLSLVSYLGNDFNFKVFTTNRDLNNSSPYEGIVPNKWLPTELNCEVYYADPTTLNYNSIKNLIDGTKFDLVYINSFFSKNFSIIPLQILNKYYADKPIVFAPRGMLGEGALAIKKMKKRIFIAYAKITGLHKNVTWHATSEQEEGEIRRVIGRGAKIVKVSNLPKKINSHAAKIKSVGRLEACFISRISEKKNLIYALEVLTKVKELNINYTIYGPIEDPVYWAKCQDLIKALPSNVCVNYGGSLSPNEIEAAYEKEHIMFLPTLNENFGHSIVESLLCGCPVIISDQTPWNDLEVNGAGFALPLNKSEQFTNAIVHYAKMNQEEFSKASKDANKYISGKIDLNTILDQYKKLFNGRT